MDDDPSFRHLLAEILSPCGFLIAEAETAEQALVRLNGRVCLSIVDFSLPDMDGMTFITKMRKRFPRTPVVFCTSNFCDAKTFDCLIHTLNVSLILQKPIEPAVFLHQLEGLLPCKTEKPNRSGRAGTAALETKVTQERFAVKEEKLSQEKTAAADQEALQEQLESEAESRWRQLPDDLTQPEEETNEHLLVQLQQMRRKLETEARIRAAQLELRKAIPPEWEKLTESIGKLKDDVCNQLLLKVCAGDAHRLRGTSGSLGLSRVSACAGKIENCLSILKPDEKQEFLWSEIFRALAEGEKSLRLAEAMERNNYSDHAGFSAGSVLVLGDDEKFQTAVSNLNPYIHADFIFTKTPSEAVMKASSFRFDAAIIDLGVVSVSALPQITRELRMISNNASLALACFNDKVSDMPDVAVLSYLGISAIEAFPADEHKLESLLRKLAVSRLSQQPRILTVDDDKVLTSFIQNVLQNIGMTVHALNEPIYILDSIEEVQPDLVLLDVMMPGLSGFDVCRTLRDQERWHATPILFLTSKSDTQGRAAAFQAGGSDLLSKPILSEELIARVRAHLDHSQAMRTARTMDGSTGTMKKDMLLHRAKEVLADAVKAKQPFSASLLRIDRFEQLASYGLFSQMNVVSMIGKLLCSRFTAEVMRGRWDDCTFAIAGVCADEDTAKAVLRSFSQEVKQMAFFLPFADKHELSVSVGTAFRINDSDSIEKLYRIAEANLSA